LLVVDTKVQACDAHARESWYKKRNDSHGQLNMKKTKTTKATTLQGRATPKILKNQTWNGVPNICFVLLFIILAHKSFVCNFFFHFLYCKFYPENKQN
jgi:hypothetical protein